MHKRWTVGQIDIDSDNTYARRYISRRSLNDNKQYLFDQKIPTD